MTVLFDFYESPPKEGEEDKLRVHARPVLTRTVTTETLAARIQERSSLTESDILAALASLSRIMADVLREGERVHLKGVGYFSVSLKCEDIKTRKDMRADRVSVKSIQFRADRQLKSDVMWVKAQRSKQGHSKGTTNEEVDHKVIEHFKQHQVMVRKDLQQACQLKLGTALRHIRRLLEEKKIKNIGSRQQPIYVPGEAAQ